jgi:RNA polymerase sigma factor (sigma-70 family)
MQSLVRPNSPLAQMNRRRAAEPARASAATTMTPDFAARGVKPPARKTRRSALRPQEQALLQRLLTEKYEYVDHELFHLPEDEAYDKVFVEPDPVPLPDVSWYQRLMDPDLPGATDPAVLARNSGTSVLLTAAQERVLFSQFNYCRKQVCDRRDRLTQADGDAAELAPAERRVFEREMLDWYVRADALRTQVADTNLALVLAMAKRTRMHPGDFADLISEGNMALLRAADKFDVSRGFKFSTYACRAILKAFSRQGIKLSKHRQMFPVDFDPKLERSNYQAEKAAAHEDDCADEVRRIVQDNLALLSDVERTVVAARFNVAPDSALRGPAPAKPRFSLKENPALAEQASDNFQLPTPLREREADAKPMTLEQVGKLIGVTKERVRQIQNKALDKIRQTLEEEYLG